MGDRARRNEGQFILLCSYSLTPTTPNFKHLHKARIALLEGERRSFENVKLDLMRRIKMLEYALRMERYVVCLSSAPS